MSNNAFIDFESGAFSGCKIKHPGALEQNGKSCVVLNKENPNIEIVLSDELKRDRFDGSEYKIKVTYFDGEMGYIAVYYTSINSKNQAAELIYFNNTGEWVTSEITLKDAFFESEEIDIRVSAKSTSYDSPYSLSDVLINKVEIECVPLANPIYPTYSIAESGNTFSWFKSQKLIDVALKNLSENTVSAEVSYKLFDYEGKEVFSENISVNLSADQEYKHTLDIGKIERCDLYTLKVYITGENINSVFTLCELAIIKTDEGGILNRDVYICSHFDVWKNDSITKRGVDMFKKANIGGARVELRWSLLETEKGKFDWENYCSKPVYEEVKNAGLDILALLVFGNVVYGAETNGHMPTSGEYLEGWLGYVRFLAELFGDDVSRYEIWNEPNMTAFNRSRATGAEYAKLVDKTTRLIHSINKKNKCGAFCMTYLGLKEDTAATRVPRHYFMEAIETGLCDDVDAIAIHPYGGIDSLEKREMKNILSFYYDNYFDKYKKHIEAWNTELGYSTYVFDSEDQKGYYNSRSSIYLKSRNMSEFNCFYNFAKKGEVKYDREDQFGMVHSARPNEKRFGTNLIPTRSFLILAGHNYCMAETENDGIFDSDDGNIRLTRFTSRKFGCKVLCVNCVEEEKELTLDLGCNTVNCFDSFGNCQALNSDNGCYKIKAEQGPKYLIGNITETKII